MRRSDAACLVAILALATLLLAPALRPGHTLLPLGLEAGIAPWHKQVTQHAKNPLLSDPFYTFYPRRHFFTESLRRGVYPLWNPYIFGGHPVVGDTAAQTFYLPNAMAALFLSAARALPVLAWFHLALTGVSMFAFLRLYRLRHGATLFGAVAWMLNGNAIVWLENPHRLSTLAWLPAVFFFYELALRRRRIWPGIVAGFLYGLSVLGGHTQFALGNGIVLGTYALFRTWVSSWREGRFNGRPLTLSMGVGLLGVGVGAVQLLPTYQLAGMSHRGVNSVATFLRGGWPVQQIIGLWVPDFYGNPVRFPYWGVRNYAEVTVYFGAFAFPLSLACPVWSRRVLGKLLGLLLILTILVALGTPLARPVAWLPWIRYFRLISLIAYVPFFGGAAAAFAMHELLGDDGRASWGMLLTVLAGLVAATVLIVLNVRAEVAARWAKILPLLMRTGLIWLLGVGCLVLVRRWPTRGVALLVALLAVDLLQWGMPFNPVSSLDILYPENEVTALLRQDPSLYRVLPLQTDRVIFGPNTLSVLGLQEIGGYSSLMVERYRQLVKAIDDEVAIWWMRPNRNMLVNSHFDSLFSLLNVKYVLATHPLDEQVTSVEVARPRGEGASLPLTAGRRITGRFRAVHPGLNRVDVEFRRTGDGPADSVHFLLWRDREGGDLVADITVGGEDLPEHGVYPFFFAPVAESAGKTFVWAVEAPEAGEEPTVAVRQAEEADQEQPAFAGYSTQLQLVDIRQGVWIYRNPNVLPRSYVVHRVDVVSDEDMLERLTAPDFNAWDTALIEEPLSPGRKNALEEASTRSNSRARMTYYGLHKIEVETETTAPGLLILSDAYYPGWKVTVDGQPARLLRANYALRAVYLPAGTHHIAFRFAPVVLYIGLTLTCATLALGSGVVLWEAYREGEGR